MSGLDDINSYEVDASSHPCVICGNNTFEWGVVSRYAPLSYRRGFRFFRDDPTHGVKARHCLTCDHLQLFVDAELSKEQNRAAWWVWLVSFIMVVMAASFIVSTLG